MERLASTGRTCASGTSTAVSVVGGSQPARSAEACTLSAGAPWQQLAGHPLEQPLTHPARWWPARRCARRRWPRTARRCRRRPARRSRRGSRPATPTSTAVVDISPPGHPGADPVRRQQRLGGAAAAGLAAAELVGALDRRRGRRPRVRAAAAAGQREEAAERELHRVADVLAHRPGQRALVARHLVDDRGDRGVGDRGQPGCASRPPPRAGAAAGDRRSAEFPAGRSSASRIVARRAPNCSERTNVTCVLHVSRTGLYALR